MTMAAPPRDDSGLLGQVLVEQGKLSRDMSAMAAQLAVVADRVSDLPDHETRLREHTGQLAAADRRLIQLEGRRSGAGWRDLAFIAPLYGLVIDLILRGLH